MMGKNNHGSDAALRKELNGQMGVYRKITSYGSTILKMRKKISIAIYCLLLLPQMSYAMINNEYLGDVSVSVEGNTRSKPQLIESLVAKCLEKEGVKSWDTVDVMSLKQCIINSRLFREVAVEVKKPEIHVLLKDRWTLIPIPNVYASNGKRSTGVFVYDSNFLGYGKLLGVGGAISTEGNTYSLFYFDSSVNYSDYTFSIMANRSNTEVDAYQSSNIIYGYEKKETGLFISPGYNITQSLGISLSLGYGDKRYSQIDSFPVPGDYNATNIGARLSYRNSDYKLFYNDGWSASFQWSRQVHRSDDKDSVTNTTAKWEGDFVVFEEQVLQLGLNLGLQSDNGNAADVSMYGRGKGFRGIEPNGLWTRKIAAASVDYQIPVAKTGHGTFTIAPFIDYGTYQPFFTGTGSNYASYGIGAYYYINLINLPGVGLVFGRNDEFMGSFAALQIGMGFQ